MPFRWPADASHPDDDDVQRSAQLLALNTSPSAYCGRSRVALRLSFLRGSAANEGSGPTQFRVRNVSKMGDIVNSSPVYVGPPQLNIADSTYRDLQVNVRLAPER